MKHRFILFMAVIAICLTSAFAQSGNGITSLRGYAERLEKFGKKIPQEQIFIHTDNTCYFLGDTLYFKAYVHRSDTGTPSNLSGLLYAELLNQDGYLVERQLIELKEGQGHGSFCLADTLYGGFYELRAYTRWQLNWGAYTHPHTDFAERFFFNKQMAEQYYRDYEKLYSRVFPVYDKPLKPGEYEHEMTLRPLRRHFKADNKPLDAVLTLYPEGGSLVAGAPCRVAFEANDEEGKHLEGTVVLKDADGKKVAEGKTEQRGRGTLEFTPVAGVKYSAQFTWKDGEKTEKLDAPETDGCALRIDQKGGKFLLTLENRGSTAQTELGLTVMSQGVMQDFRELGKGESMKAEYKLSDLKGGVVQFTVFDAQGRIYADRLAFVRNDDMKGRSVKVSGGDKLLEPYSKVQMSVEGGQAGDVLSVAVRDGASTEYLYDNATMQTELLLSSQIRGFVENPGYFFESDDAEHQRALDLLLMIQGWRRYSWKTMAVPGEFALKYMPEQTQVMSGEVNRYIAQLQDKAFEENDYSFEDFATEEAGKAFKGMGSMMLEDYLEELAKREKGPDTKKMLEDFRDESENEFVKGTPHTSEDVDKQFRYDATSLKQDVLVHALFAKPGSDDKVTGDVKTEKGHFNIQSPRFYDKCYFFLAASDSAKWPEAERQDPTTHVWMVGGEDKNGNINYPEFYVKLNPIYPRFVKPYGWYQTHLADVPQDAPLVQTWRSKDAHVLTEVTVGARRDGLNKFDASKPAYVIDAADAFNDVCDAGLATGVFYGSERFVQNVARNYIGDMNMERQYEVVTRYDTHDQSHYLSTGQRDKYNHLSNLYKIYIYTDYSPRREGDKKFEQSNQPSVDIDLRLIPNDGKREIRANRRYVLQGYAVCEDFYQPDYGKSVPKDHPDYRRTLYWNPDLKLDGKGKAKIEFYNNGKKTQTVVSVEGMATDGTPVSLDK